MEYKLFFPTPLDRINPRNDNIDVCMTTEDGRSFTFVVATPDNLKTLMIQNDCHYISPGAPFLIVEELNETVIYQLMDELVTNEALLQGYGSDQTAQNNPED